MSSQKGNTSRTRPQKYKNSRAFKNDLHDKTPKNKFINGINISNVCERCKNIFEWKIKYKKYKPLTAPRKCTKCEQKTIKHAYHILCHGCASQCKVCPGCGKEKELASTTMPKEEQFQLDKEMQQSIKALSERKRRTFFRYLAKKEKEPAEQNSSGKEDLLAKLETLKIQSAGDDESDDSTWDEEFDTHSNSENSDSGDSD